jgi:hypothetical protein
MTKASEIFSLYVILKPVKKNLTTHTVIQRLETIETVQEEVSKKFFEMLQHWRNSTPIHYTPSYKPDDDEIFYYEDFTISSELTKAAKHRQQFEEFKKSDLEAKELSLKAIFAIHKDLKSEKTTYFFQLTDRRHILDKRKWYPMIYLVDKYVPLEDHAITIGDHLTAVITPEGKLLFRSFRDASQLLDLVKYFRIATDQDIRSILSIDKIANGYEDISYIISICDDTMRKRFSIILSEGTLANDTVKVQSLVKKAKDFGIEVKMKGQPPDFKLLFPTKKETLKQFLKFLCQDYYESILTGDRCVSNSHRKLSS